MCRPFTKSACCCSLWAVWLVGLFQFDLVGWLLGGSTSVWSRIVFALVGLAALGCIPELFNEEPEEE